MQVQEYISKRYAEVIRSHLGLRVRAADTLAAIHEDNMTMTQNATFASLQSLLLLIRDFGQLPRTMNFLCQMCGTAERPVPRNQNMLTAMLETCVLEVLVPAAATGEALEVKRGGEVCYNQRLWCKREVLCVQGEGDRVGWLGL